MSWAVLRSGHAPRAASCIIRAAATRRRKFIGTEFARGALGGVCGIEYARLVQKKCERSGSFGFENCIARRMSARGFEVEFVNF